MFSKRHAGDVAVVTGSAASIGRAVAGALHTEGATVALIDIDELGAIEAASKLGDGRACAFAADVGNGGEIANAFANLLTTRSRC